MRQSRPSGHSLHSPTRIFSFQSAGAGPPPSAPSSSHAGSGMEQTIVTRSRAAWACSSMARAAARDSTEPGGKSQGRGIRLGSGIPLVGRFIFTLDGREPFGKLGCHGVGFNLGFAHALIGSTQGCVFNLDALPGFALRTTCQFLSGPYVSLRGLFRERVNAPTAWQTHTTADTGASEQEQPEMAMAG